MKPEDIRSLSNHFQSVRLVSLRTWKAAAEFAERDANGPYMVAQKAYAPDDPTVTANDFVLARTGQWLAVADFFRLPVGERRAACVFGTAAEVMALMQGLPPKAVVASRASGEPAPTTPGAEDDLKTAYETGLQDAPQG